MPAAAAAAAADRIGYWQRDAGATDRWAGPPLPGSADVVVIGGGLAGLATAIALREMAPQAVIVLLEAARVGHGASGRNAGFLSPLAAPIWMLGAERSRDQAWAAAHLNQEMHARARWIASHLPRAELTPARLSLQAQGRWSDAALGEFARAIEVTGLSHGLGANVARPPWRVLAMAAYTVHPVHLIDGLAAHAAQPGVCVRERAPVVELTREVAGVRVRLRDQAIVRARKVVVCTNAYAGAYADARALLGRVAALPMHAFMTATEAVPATRPAASAGDVTVEMNPLQAYYRCHGDRILYGGIDQLRAPGGGDGAAPARQRRRLQAAMRASLGDRPGLTIVDAWSGALHATTTGLPIIRASTANPDVVINVGYAGTGVALTLACALLAAGLALGGFRTADDARLWATIRATRVDAGAAVRAVTRIARAGDGPSR